MQRSVSDESLDETSGAGTNSKGGKGGKVEARYLSDMKASPTKQTKTKAATVSTSLGLLLSQSGKEAQQPSKNASQATQSDPQAGITVFVTPAIPLTRGNGNNPSSSSSSSSSISSSSSTADASATPNFQSLGVGMQTPTWAQSSPVLPSILTNDPLRLRQSPNSAPVNNGQISVSLTPLFGSSSTSSSTASSPSSSSGLAENMIQSPQLVSSEPLRSNDSTLFKSLSSSSSPQSTTRLTGLKRGRADSIDRKLKSSSSQGAMLPPFTPPTHPSSANDNGYLGTLNKQGMGLSLNGGGGSSCHQCKSRRPVSSLIFCSHVSTSKESSSKRDKRSPKKRKTRDSSKDSQRTSCRKKYCDQCLWRFYQEKPTPKSIWICPSCRGQCTCAACKRAGQKGKPVAFDPTAIVATIVKPDPSDSTTIQKHNSGEGVKQIDPLAMSPATSVAAGLVYFKDLLTNEMEKDRFRLNNQTAPSPNIAIAGMAAVGGVNHNININAPGTFGTQPGFAPQQHSSHVASYSHRNAQGGYGAGAINPQTGQYYTAPPGGVYSTGPYNTSTSTYNTTNFNSSGTGVVYNTTNFGTLPGTPLPGTNNNFSNSFPTTPGVAGGYQFPSTNTQAMPTMLPSGGTLPAPSTSTSGSTTTGSTTATGTFAYTGSTTIMPANSTTGAAATFTQTVPTTNAMGTLPQTNSTQLYTSTSSVPSPTNTFSYNVGTGVAYTGFTGTANTSNTAGLAATTTTTPGVAGTLNAQLARSGSGTTNMPSPVGSATPMNISTSSPMMTTNVTPPTTGAPATTVNVLGPIGATTTSATSTSPLVTQTSVPASPSGTSPMAISTTNTVGASPTGSVLNTGTLAGTGTLASGTTASTAISPTTGGVAFVVTGTTTVAPSTTSTASLAAATSPISSTVPVTSTTAQTTAPITSASST